MQEVAVGRVKLDQVEASIHRTPRSPAECLDDLADARLVQGLGDGMLFAKGHRARAEHGPASLRRAQRIASLPGDVATGLAPGVGQLDADGRPLSLDEASD